MRSLNRVELMKQQLDSALQSVEDPSSEQAAALVASTPPTAPAPDLLRTAMRLVVGTLLLTVDSLAQRAPIWERLATQGEAAVLPTADGAQELLTAPEPAAEAAGGLPPAPVAPTDNQLTLALIGWAAAIPEQLRPDADPRSLLMVARAHLEATMAAVTRGSLVMASGGRLGPPTMLDDPDLRRWIGLGQSEAQRSRELASVAIVSLVEEAVNYLASEPAVQQIVQEQGTTLASDVLGEVREYSVSGDTFVDGLVRRLLRRRPRPSKPGEAPVPPTPAPALGEG
ncbi:MAG: hypothetical protein HGA45_31520 [Chloroflexales bacterium]|nr:hypothetical protein [Chloroflexales bacterium]